MSQDKVVIRTFAGVLAILVVAAIGFYIVAHVVTSDLGPEGPNERMQAKMIENIRPVGQVNVGAVPASATASGGVAAARSGEQIYNAVCMACHVAGVAGAPKTGDTAAWTPRAAKGIDGLLESATNGLNAMPPKGTCADCSPDELKSAITYLLGQAGL